MISIHVLVSILACCTLFLHFCAAIKCSEVKGCTGSDCEVLVSYEFGSVPSNNVQASMAKDWASTFIFRLQMIFNIASNARLRSPIALPGWTFAMGIVCTVAGHGSYSCHGVGAVT